MAVLSFGPLTLLRAECFRKCWFTAFLWFDLTVLRLRARKTDTGNCKLIQLLGKVPDVKLKLYFKIKLFFTADFSVRKSLKMRAKSLQQQPIDVLHLQR